jgi:hypothetical protein
MINSVHCPVFNQFNRSTLQVSLQGCPSFLWQRNKIFFVCLYAVQKCRNRSLVLNRVNFCIFFYIYVYVHVPTGERGMFRLFG